MNKPLIMIDSSICSLINSRNEIFAGGDEHKKDLIMQMKSMADSHLYLFSFAFLFFEKLSSCCHFLPVGKEIDDILSELCQVADFLGRSHVVALPDEIVMLTSELNEVLSLEHKRLNLFVRKYFPLILNFSKLFLPSTFNKKLRLSFTAQVIANGKKMGIESDDPVILICIASLYGCPEARRILAIKKNHRIFTPEITLRNLLSFYFSARTCQQIRELNPTAEVYFRMEDEALERLHDFLDVQLTENSGEAIILRTTCRAPERLFPALFNTEGECTGRAEREVLYGMLGLPLCCRWSG